MGNQRSIKEVKRKCKTVHIEDLIKLYKSTVEIVGALQQSKKAQIDNTERSHKTDIKQS